MDALACCRSPYEPLSHDIAPLQSPAATAADLSHAREEPTALATCSHLN